MTSNLQTQANTYLFNTYNRYPITLVRGEGAWVWDETGKKYLDLLSGIACTPLGHHHPAVTQAIAHQINQILHTSNLYYSPPCIELAKWLVEQGGLDKVFFCNSGAEANETAIKLARKYQWMKNSKQKQIILSAHHSFHGRTLGALAATAKPQIQEGFGPMPNGFNYHSWDDIEKFCDAIDDHVAAVILEPIQGEGGVQVASKEFLHAVRNKCNQKDVLLIFDEVQCGVGRSGELFAYQHFGVQPDIITLAKGVANGLPLGIVCARNQVASAFSPGDHGTTFGGNPVSCCAAIATLETIFQHYLPRVKQLGSYLLTQLIKLRIRYPDCITNIHGIGLMIGIKLNQNPQRILSNCQNAGLLLNITADNILRLLPPYILTEMDIDHAISILDQVLQDETT